MDSEISEMTSSQTIPINEEKNGKKDSCLEIEIPFDMFQYLTSEDCNIQSLCRICLSANNETKFPLLCTKDSELLPHMYTSFTAIQLCPDDGLPSNICELCKTQVVNCYEFKIKCVQSDCTLRSLLKGEFMIKEEPSDDKTRAPENTVEKHGVLKITDIKEEDLNEEEYLEDFNYIECDRESICVKEKKRKKRKKVQGDSITEKKVKLQKPKCRTCSFCSKKFTKLKTLRAHIENYHDTDTRSHQCGQCKQSFTSEHDLQLHSALHAKGPMWKCTECHKEFKAKSMLRRHIGRHMEAKRYSCETCGKPFAELYALRRHTRVHTGERVEKRHVCHICDKRYSEGGLLAAHLARHTGERPCVCATCGKTFPSARLLASHHLVHSDNKPYACRYCEKRFRHESTRNTHHRTHTGEKPYVCAACGKTFIQNSNLTLHMRTHTGEKPYSCETCGRKFTSGSSLKNHIRTHTGEKPYGCHVCGKTFVRRDISAHMCQHTGERPFECSVCPRRFVTATRLRDHCRIHTGEKPFECAMCTLKFSSKSHLRKHVKKHLSKQDKKKVERDVVIVQQVDYQPYILPDKFIITHQKEDVGNFEENLKQELREVESNDKVDQEAPLEVTGELVLQDDTEMVVDDDQGTNFQNGTLCLSTGGVNYVNSDVNLVTVNEGEVSISASSAMVEGTTVKLYQLDQSLVQIHSSGGQVTISKITSKMTANF